MRVLALFAVLFALLLPIHGQEKTSHPDNQSQNTRDVTKTPCDGVTVSFAIDPKVLSLMKEMHDTVGTIPKARFLKIIAWVGRVSYRDNLLIERETGIYRSYDPSIGQFQPTQVTDLEYAD